MPRRLPLVDMAMQLINASTNGRLSKDESRARQGTDVASGVSDIVGERFVHHALCPSPWPQTCSPLIIVRPEGFVHATQDRERVLP